MIKTLGTTVITQQPVKGVMQLPTDHDSTLIKHIAVEALNIEVKVAIPLESRVIV